MLEKALKFVSSKKNNIVIFNLGLLLLLVKADFILKEQSYKKKVLGVCDTDCGKIVLALLTEVETFYMAVTIVQVRVLGLRVVSWDMKFALPCF